MTNQRSSNKAPTKKHVARLEREQRQVAIVRITAIVMIGIVLLLVGYGYLDTKYFKFQKPVAEVNGEKVTIKEWQERVQMQRVNLTNLYQRYQFFQQNFGMDMSQQLQQLDYYLQSPEAVGQLVLDQMVDEILIRQEAEKRGITVTDAEVEQFIQEAFNFYAEGTPTPTITPTAFAYPTLSPDQLTYYPATATPTSVPTSTPEPTATPDLSTPTSTPEPVKPHPTPTFVPEDATPTSTPYTLDGFKSEFQKTIDQYKKYGISEATFRNAFKNSLYRNKLQEVISKDQPAKAEQVWARHILVDNEAEAKTIKALLDHGSDFDQIAKKYSKDTGSGAKGGDLGWFGKGAMVPEFEAAAFSQSIGVIGEPVKSQFGYHIIQVLARQELPFTESELQQNNDTAFTDWLTSARDSAKTTKYDDAWKNNIPPMPDFQNQQQ